MRRWLAIFLFCSVAWATTTNTRYVDPGSLGVGGGGDGTTTALSGANCAYASLSEWEAQRQADLVSGDIIEKVICRNSTGAADTTAVTIDGWTTDATRYIDITVDASYRHAGIYSTSLYRIETATTALSINEDYVRVNGLQFKVTTSASGTHGVSVSAGSDVRLENLIIRCVPTGAITNYGIYIGGAATVNSKNCYIYGWKGGSSVGVLNNNASGVINLYNATLYDNQVSCYRNGGTFLAKNCLSQSTAASDGFGGTFSASSTNNMSDVASDAPGTNSYATAETVSFVDAANGDFHQNGYTPATGAGANLSADATYPFSDDVDGATRSGQWDIGADQQSAASSRFWLSASTAADVTVANETWDRTGEGEAAEMDITKDGTTLADNGNLGNNANLTADWKIYSRQYVSNQVAAGIAFTTATKVYGVIRCMESATNDNLNRTPSSIRVTNAAGTVQAQLLSLSHYGPTTGEFVSGTRTNRIIFDGDALTSAYTTSAGDRVVFETGIQVDGTGGTSVQGTQSFGSSAVLDLAYNETATTALNPWLDFVGVTITAYVAPPATTRYVPPQYDISWLIREFKEVMLCRARTAAFQSSF